MFISNYDKEQMRVAIRTLQSQVTNLIDEIKELKASNTVKKVVKKKPAPIFRTAEAPWGYKLNGSPRKRPGRPDKANKETQS